MAAKRMLIPFLLASFAGHLLLVALAARVDAPGGEGSGRSLAVALGPTLTVAPPETAPRRALSPGTAPDPPAAHRPGPREESVTLGDPGSPYGSYLQQVRRRIEARWAYPPQALSGRAEGDAVVRFTIDADGALTGYYVTASSGSPLLDEGALACLRASSPFEPLPAAFALSRLHVTATFRYRLRR